MNELAQQELMLLEAQHPTRFQYLKLHVKEFIHEQDQQPCSHTSIITEESSSGCRKREREEEKDDGYSEPKPKPKPKPKSKSEPKIRKRKRKGEGIRDAIHKAEACLHKIQSLKSFFCSSNH